MVKGWSSCFIGDPQSLPWGIIKIAAYDFWDMHQYPIQWVLDDHRSNWRVRPTASHKNASHMKTKKAEMPIPDIKQKLK